MSDPFPYDGLPAEHFWRTAYFDPFRPLIQPRGFSTVAELHADREAHLAATVRAFEECDAFVLTLGLTEAWIDPRDGAVFPIPPGRGRGTFEVERVAFKNFGIE